MKPSVKIKIKTFNLVLSFIESILARLKRKNIVNPANFLTEELGTSKAYISNIFNCEGNFTVKTPVSLANAADLDVEIVLRDKKSSKRFKHTTISTAEDLWEPLNISPPPLTQSEPKRDLLI